MATSKVTTISNYFRPTRGEAVARVRVNALCLLTICIATYLLPLPSIPSSLILVLSKSQEDRDSALTLWWRGISLLEVAVTTICSYNILEGLYAIKYPRKPLPAAHNSPLKKKQGLMMSPSPMKRPSSIISPNATPSKSLSLSTKNFGQSLGGSTTPGKLKYAESPLSTPSRVVRYTMPPQPSSTASASTNASSTSTMPPTPSPIVSAYRGKQASMGTAGRPIDGLYLSQMSAREEDEDES